MVKKIFLLFILASIFLINFTYAMPYVTFTPTPTITPISTTNFGAPFKNMTQSNFSLLYLPLDVLAPYTWVSMGSYTVFMFIVLMFIFMSMWRSGSDIRIPTIIGMLFGSMILFGGGGLGIQLPPEVSGVAYGCILASIAGLMVGVFKRI